MERKTKEEVLESFSGQMMRGKGIEVNPSIDDYGTKTHFALRYDEYGNESGLVDCVFSGDRRSFRNTLNAKAKKIDWDGQVKNFYIVQLNEAVKDPEYTHERIKIMTPSELLKVVH